MIFLAVFYFGTSQGATLYLHYCMGALVQTGIVESESSSCEFCGMDSEEAEEASCCKKETKILKVDDAQKMVPSHFQFEQASAIVLKFIIWDARPIATLIKPVTIALSNAPPQQKAIPVYIHNCTFRI